MTKVVTTSFVALGAAPMMMYMIFGNIMTHLTNYHKSIFMRKPEDPMGTIWNETVSLIIVAVVAIVMKFFDTFFWIRIVSYLSTRLKKGLFVNMMRSDVTFFDVNRIGSILTPLSEDVQQVEDAFGQIKGAQLTNMGQSIMGVCMAFAYD
jgi:ABC-type multidrug transport system fused ATPase/permease subunit